LTLGGDLLIGIALADAKRRANLRGDLLHTYELLISATEDARSHPLTTEAQHKHQQNIANLRAAADELLHTRTPFHWPLAFPEVFVGEGDEAGFAAVVGNPPFQGGQKITGAIGTDYRDYLVEYLANGKRGSADLCAYFFLNATRLVRHKGMSALIATNTIAQGDTREVGLDQIVASGWTIPRAIPSRKWPGEANLEVAQVWLREGEWQGPYILNDIAVANITPLLTTPGTTQGNPYKLIANMDKSFQGSIVLGMGFVLEPEEAQNLISKDIRNKDVLFPYLNGEDLNSRPDQSPSRWVINFHDWPLEKAETYANCMQIVYNKVKPERDKNNRQTYRDKWWHFGEKRPALYSTIADMKRVLVRARVSNTNAFIFVPQDKVFSEMIVAFASDEYEFYMLLQSSIHSEWFTYYASTLGVGIRYTPSDCFETFPFPTNTDALESIGERYYTHRQSIMLTRQEGLTKTYNRFHNRDEHAADIGQLRELHREMDETVARAYGWDDLRLEHGFHETKQGLRYTISEAARREVLDRLLLLNHARHAEEVAAGLVDANGKPLKGKAKMAKDEKGGKGAKAGLGKVVDGEDEGLWG
ncbi:MAG: DNA methyltransferase, partial [Ktedonobacteraceae bacterium]